MAVMAVEKTFLCRKLGQMNLFEPVVQPLLRCVLKFDEIPVAQRALQTHDPCLL